MTRLALPCTTLTLREADRIVAFVKEFGEQKAMFVRKREFGMGTEDWHAFIRRNRFMWQEPASDLG